MRKKERKKYVVKGVLNFYRATLLLTKYMGQDVQ